MGARSSKSSIPHNRFADSRGATNYYGVGRTVYETNEFKSNSTNEAKSYTQSDVTPSEGRLSVDKPPQEWKQLKEPSLFPEVSTTGYGNSEDDFYDGIPRFPRALSQKSRSMRSRQAGAKVSDASSRVGKPRTLGLGKAVEVLDTLGSSMTSLNQSSGFVSAAKTKGNELQILAFEVANTIVKGSMLMQSLSKRSIRQLREVVLTSEGVQLLVSENMNELLTIVATDKREEFRTFTAEVVRFGNRSKDSQWHNLNRYFEKRSKELAPHKQSQEEAEQMMQQLMTLVVFTLELYTALQAMDRVLEQDFHRKRFEEDNPYAAQRGDNFAFLRTDIKDQKKLVKNLKKKSLWSRSLEEVMEKLVDIVLFLNREIHTVFGNADCDKPSGGSLGNRQRLGPSGLALHYANMVIQIDTIVARSSSMPSSLRDTLYQSLPPNLKSSLRTKLHSFHVKEGLTIPEIKDEMEKTLHWLVPIAINTAKAHHGFGWVGEWANTGSGSNRKPAGPMPIEVNRIETFDYADKEKTEAYILELLLWLNHLVKQCMVGGEGEGEGKSAIKSPLDKTPKKPNQHPVQSAIVTRSPDINVEDQGRPQEISTKSGHDINVEDQGRRQEISTKSGHEEQESGS